MARRLLILLASASILAGCGQKDAGSAPTGQVVATVDGKEITTSDLRLELGAAANDPATAAKQQGAALQAVINRKLLAEAAEERKLDQTPVAAMLIAKARELALIELLQQSIREGTPKVSEDEAKAYVQDNPMNFAQRKLLTVDQLIVPKVTPALVKEMEPLNTMSEITALLDKNKVEFRRSGSVIDTVAVAPDAAGKINALGVGDVFITPAGGGAQISAIRDIRAEPLTGEQAVQAATAILTQKRGSGLLEEQMGSIIKAGQSKVKLNPAYETKPAAGAKTPAPTAK